MSNLRIIYDNVANSSTLSASTTAGSLVAANMLNDSKVVVHRSTGPSVVYTMTWASAQTVGAVALPATNLTSAATIRVQLYSDTAGTTQIADSGTVAACPSSTLGLHGWGANIDANAFAFGGSSKSAVWMATQHSTVRRCVITLSDATNPAGFIDCSRIVLGPYWESERNPGYGAQAGVQDMSRTQRTEAGDALVVRGAQYQTMSLSLADMTETSRAAFTKIVRSAGSYKNLFISLLPGVGSTAEQDHMIYGKRSNGGFTFDYFNGFSTRVEIEGW